MNEHLFSVEFTVYKTIAISDVPDIVTGPCYGCLPMIIYLCPISYLVIFVFCIQKTCCGVDDIPQKEGVHSESERVNLNSLTVKKCLSHSWLPILGLLRFALELTLPIIIRDSLKQRSIQHSAVLVRCRLQCVLCHHKSSAYYNLREFIQSIS